jgi:hypothetical protein
LGLGDAIAVAEALGGAMAWLATGNLKVFKSELLISNVPSLPSTRAQHVPSLF